MSEDNNPDPQLTYEPVKVAVVHEHRILVRGPYNTSFIARAKVLRGQWNEKSELWIFPGEHEARVRLLCQNWFGTDGSLPPDLVDVQVSFHEAYSQDAVEATIFGRVIANARGRAGAIRVGEGISFIQGDAISEAVGMRRRTVIAAGSRVRVVAVPRALAEAEPPPGIEVSIIERPPPCGDASSQRDDPDCKSAHAGDPGGQVVDE
jgi:hypothetical protein